MPRRNYDYMLDPPDDYAEECEDCGEDLDDCECDELEPDYEATDYFDGPIDIND